MQEKVSVIGTGRMGSALATALLNKAFPTTVWNRTPSRTQPLAKLGIAVARDLGEAVLASGVIVVNVSDYAAAWGLIRDPGIEAALQGKTLVQLCTGLPAEAREMQAWAAQHGISYLDGAIMSYPEGIGNPDCTVLYSGSAGIFDRLKPILLAFGDNAIFVGDDPGHASALDMALVNFLMSSVLSFLQGQVVCEEEGVPPDAFFSLVKALMPVIEGSLGDAFTRMQARNYADTQASLESWSAAPREMVAWSRQHGIDHSVAAAQLALFEKAIQAGRAQQDLACLCELYKAS